MQIDIIYVAMGVHNFIKSYLRNKKDIYSTLTNIPDNAKNNGTIPIMQSSSIEMNSLRDQMAAKIWENY